MREQHQADLGHGAGWVELPGSLLRKYPSAGRDWGWQWVFPATRFYVDRATGSARTKARRFADPLTSGTWLTAVFTRRSVAATAST